MESSVPSMLEGGLHAQERRLGRLSALVSTVVSPIAKGGSHDPQERPLGLVTPLAPRVRAMAQAAARTYAPSLPRPVWILQAGGFANAIGSGLVLPFVLIYLHDALGMPLVATGLAVGGYGLASLVATPVAGALVDRLGARAVLRFSLVLLAVGYGAFPLVRTVPEAFAVLAFAGLGNGGFWPSQSALIMGLSGADRRHQASALGRATYNLGLGAGSALGGLVLAGASISRFEILFALDAATFVGFALATLAVPPVVVGPSTRTTQRSGYSAVVRDRIFVALILLNVVYVAGAFAPFESALPLYARHHLGISTRAIGFVFLANMLAVGVLQLPAARAIEGRRRLRMLAAMTGLWAVAFVLIFGSGVLPQALAMSVIVLAAIVFAAGECVLGPAHSPIVVQLAPPELRGRYLAVLTASYAVGFTLGPPLAAAGLTVSPGGLWIFAALVCVLAAAAGLALERRLPEALRSTPSSV
jgi:MFS family permease